MFERLNTGPAPPLPDTVAVEIVVPALIAAINAHLARLDAEPVDGLGGWRAGRRLRYPPGANPELLARLRRLVDRGHPVPAKLLHTLEVLGDSAEGAPFVEPVHGCVGCSPAATATWLGDRTVRAGRHRGVRYLEAVQERGGGPVPVAAPLASFERAWVLASLAGAGLGIPVHGGMLRSLHNAFGETGMSGGPGLPPDVDDTAAALYALALLGSPRRPDSLWAYRSGQHFMTYPAERTPSTTANAHVLQALGANLTRNLPHRERYLDAAGAVIGWLCDHQQADGSWPDKWHASPYYATACCAIALADYGGGAAAPAVRRAVRWVLDTQRGNGSWGRWAGTGEETAYAVQILLRSHVTPTATIERAVASAVQFLMRPEVGADRPPLWHDKDLYTPHRIVRVERAVAVCLALTNPGVVERLAAQPWASTIGKDS